MDASDDVLAFTNTTEGTMETRIVNIKSKFENITTDIETLIKQSDIKRQHQAEEELNKYQTCIDQEAKNNQEIMHQLQESMNKILFFQKGLQEAGSITSTTSNKINQSNKSDATTESPSKRKSDILMKGKKQNRI